MINVRRGKCMIQDCTKVRWAGRSSPPPRVLICVCPRKDAVIIINRSYW